MNAGITRDEWLKALGEAVKPADPDAMTVKEIAESCGIGRQAAYLHIRRLISEKKAVATYKDIQTRDGRRRVPAYKLVKPKK